MKIDTSKWEWFRIEELFDKLETGKGHDTLLDDGNDCLYLGAKKSDNGVMRTCAVNESMRQKGNCIVFICNGAGSVGYANYMDKPFIATTDLVLGYADWINEKTGLFVATVLCKERFKYSFGRKWKTHLRDTKIKLPATMDGKPDWQWMESYIDSLHSKPLTTENEVSTVADLLDICAWQAFFVGDIFDIVNGKGITTEEIESNPGDLEAVQSGEGNNGVMGHIDKVYCHNKGYSYCEEPCLTVARSGTSGFVSFHENGCVVGDSAKILLLKEPSARTAPVYLFLRTLLEANRFKYTYGRKVTESLYRETVIKLPTTSDGKPDWPWMENYIKSLPYGDRLL